MARARVSISSAASRGEGCFFSSRSVSVPPSQNSVEQRTRRASVTPTPFASAPVASSLAPRLQPAE